MCSGSVPKVLSKCSGKARRLKQNVPKRAGFRFAPDPALRPQGWRFTRSTKKPTYVALGTDFHYRGLLQDIKRSRGRLILGPRVFGNECSLKLILKRLDLPEGTHCEN